MDIKDFVEIIKIEALSRVTACGRLVGCKPLSSISFMKILDDGHIIASAIQFRKSSNLIYEIEEDSEYIVIKTAFEKEEMELLNNE